MSNTHGFTSQTLGWSAWLDTVALEQATPAQIAVLEASHPQAKTSDYYLLLVHEPQVLAARSGAFNSIMYAPGGLTRTAASTARRCTRSASSSSPNAAM